MKDLFFLLLVTLPYFSFYSVSITQCYLDATYTSATILKSNSDFLSNLQLATVVNDASWRARLLHKHKGSLKKIKQSLFWLSCLKDSKLDFILVVYFLLVFKAKSNKPFGPRVKTSLKQTASKALLKSNSEIPNPEDTILKWVFACVNYHRVFNFPGLTTQFLLFLPYISQNQNAFYNSFLRLSGADTSTFFDIMVFVHCQGVDPKLQNELNCLLKLYHQAVFNKMYTYQNDQNLQPTDIQLILKSHMALVLYADIFLYLRAPRNLRILVLFCLSWGGPTTNKKKSFLEFF
jgi:hypothetical protein